MPAFRSNAKQLAQAWEKRANQLRPTMRAATTEATRTAYAESKRQLTELIYDKPEDTIEQVSRRRGVVTSTGEGANAQATLGAWAMVGPKGKKHPIVLPLSTRKGKAYGKKKAWRRTGNLRRQEKMRVASAYVGLLINDASTKGKGGRSRGYAAARHNTKRTRRPAPWRDKALASIRGRVRIIYREAMIRAMRVGTIPRPT